MASFFAAVIEKAKDGFSAYVPDLPGCTSAGDDIQQAARNVAEAAQVFVSVAHEHGDEIPQPSEALVRPDHDFVAIVLVPVELPGRAERVNVTFETSVLAAIDRKAEARGLNRSAYLAMAALKEGIAKAPKAHHAGKKPVVVRIQPLSGAKAGATGAKRKPGVTIGKRQAPGSQRSDKRT